MEKTVPKSLKNAIAHISDLMGLVTYSMDEMHAILEKIVGSVSDDDGRSTEDTILTIQLILQYRLSCEDALSCLLTIDHNLLYLLGIQPSNSSKMNAERLAYAVGNEDLKQILNILSMLISSLLKIIARSHHNQATFSQKHTSPKLQHEVVRKCCALTDSQKQFSDSLSKLNLAIKQLVKRAPIGPVLDHIAALRGPISQFHQAIVHGLDQAKHLYRQLHKTPILSHQLQMLLDKTDKVLRAIPTVYKPQLNYSVKKFDHRATREQLEQRASLKRLRPFFG